MVPESLRGGTGGLLVSAFAPDSAMRDHNKVFLEKIAFLLFSQTMKKQ